MTSLTAIFGHARDDTSESEKLLELYWNRAELKREFADLRSETFRLKERIRDEKGRSARYEQKFQQLENLLLDGDWVYSVVVAYQLKSVNARMCRKLARFAENLKQQREKSVQNRQMQDWSSVHADESQRIERTLAELQSNKDELEEQLQAERFRLSRRPWLFSVLLRRRTTRRLDKLAGRCEEAAASLKALQCELESHRNRAAPDTQGLDLSSKRSINFMILSYAQFLYLHCNELELSEMVHEAGARGVGSLRYGGRQECMAILARIDALRSRSIKLSAMGDELQRRAQLIAHSARFRNSEEAVPVAASVNAVFDCTADERPSTTELNVLGENFWDVRSVLSR